MMQKDWDYKLYNIVETDEAFFGAPTHGGKRGRGTEKTKVIVSVSLTDNRNPMFAKATGINVDRSRIIANMMSTAIAAVGIIVYAQGFGFVQLYDFPMLLAFPAVASVLVGGASAQRAKVTNVIVGTFLFQGLLAIALPVFTRVLDGADVVNPIRMVIQNGIILYALSQMSKGGKS